MAELAPGTEFAGCVIQDVAGRGGMGVVYRARQTSLNRVVALKLIDPRLAAEPEFTERFRREALAGAAIEHPNVVPVYDAGERDGTPYIVMRLVDGDDLGTEIRQGTLSPRDAALLVAQVADALAAAHERGLVHRDVKPANVMVAGDRAYLTDFGVARLVDAEKSMTRSGAVVGSVGYIAPELVEGGHGGPASDIYSLGCVLYECLTGVPPFPRETPMAAMFAHVNEPVPHAKDLSPKVAAALDAVAFRAMQKDPEQRFGSATEMRGALLEAAAGATPVDAPRVLASAPTETTVPTDDVTAALARPEEARPALRRPWVLALIVAAVTAAAIAAFALGAFGPTDRLAGRPVSLARADSPIAVGNEPEAVIAAGDIWVANAGDGTVSRINPKSKKVIGPPSPVGASPTGLAATDGLLWIANQDDDSVSLIDTATGKPAGQPVPVGRRPDGIVAGSDSVWVANAGESTLTRLNVDDPRGRTDTITLDETPGALAFGEGSVWVANPEAGSVTKIDPGSGTVAADPISVGTEPRGLAIGFGYLWVANAGDGTVVRVDPNTSEVAGDPIEVGANARGIASGPGAIWVTSTDRDSVTRIDAAGPTPSAPIPVGDDPEAVAVGGGGAWVANRLDGTVTPVHQ